MKNQLPDFQTAGSQSVTKCNRLKLEAEDKCDTPTLPARRDEDQNPEGSQHVAGG